LREVLRKEWVLILAGLVSDAFGVWLIAAPRPGALAILYALGACTTLFGVLVVPSPSRFAVS
jgi:uncharacterized membrane protein HdeD (DUF308 family)